MNANLSRRQLLASATLAATGLAAGPSLAQAFPDKSRPIKLVIPFGPGTSTDLLGRAVARAMNEAYGVNVVVDNRVGADGAIGMQATKQAAPDGYTFAITTLSTQVVGPHLYKQLPYDALADFIPLAGVARTPLMFNFSPTVPIKTVAEFVAAAKASPEKFTFGSASTTTRLVGEIFQNVVGVKLLNVPYKAFSDTMTDLTTGRIDLVFVDPATAGPFYAQGVRPLAITSPARSTKFPQVPTAAEAGVPGFEIGGWFAAYAPAKTPAQAVAAMREMLVAAQASKYVQEVHANFAMQALALSGDALAAFQREEFDRWGKAAKAAGLVGTL